MSESHDKFTEELRERSREWAERHGMGAINVNLFYHYADERPPAWAREMLALLKQSARKESAIMASIDDVINDVQAESTVIDSVGALVTSLRQQIADALSGATLPPAVQAKIDQAFSGLEANKAKLAQAVVTGTPNDTTTGGTGGDTTTGASGGDAVTGTPTP